MLTQICTLYCIQLYFYISFYLEIHFSKITPHYVFYTLTLGPVCMSVWVHRRSYRSLFLFQSQNDPFLLQYVQQDFLSVTSPITENPRPFTTKHSPPSITHFKHQNFNTKQTNRNVYSVTQSVHKNLFTNRRDDRNTLNSTIRN